MANNWQSWTALIGGVVAIIGQFVPGYYLALIGGILAAVAGIAEMME